MDRGGRGRAMKGEPEDSRGPVEAGAVPRSTVYCEDTLNTPRPQQDHLRNRVRLPSRIRSSRTHREPHAVDAAGLPLAPTGSLTLLLPNSVLSGIALGVYTATVDRCIPQKLANSAIRALSSPLGQARTERRRVQRQVGGVAG